MVIAVSNQNTAATLRAVLFSAAIVADAELQLVHCTHGANSSAWDKISTDCPTKSLLQQFTASTRAGLTLISSNLLSHSASCKPCIVYPKKQMNASDMRNMILSTSRVACLPLCKRAAQCVTLSRQHTVHQQWHAYKSTFQQLNAATTSLLNC